MSFESAPKSEEKIPGKDMEEVTEYQESRQEYINDIVINVEGLQQDAIRFEKHTQDIIERLESLDPRIRVKAAEEYSSSMWVLTGELRKQLQETNSDLSKYIMDKKVGEYIDQLKSSFSGSYKGPESRSSDGGQDESREKIETAVSSAFERFSKENIPAVNIPAIITLCARIGILQDRISMAEEAKVMISGYLERESASKENIKEGYIRKAKEIIGGILRFAENDDVDYKFEQLNKECSMVGITSERVFNAQQYYKTKNFEKMREELVNLDKDLTELL